jgi:Ala-tRNA(Pro) deacylase
MTMASRIAQHLKKTGVHYDLIQHTHSASSLQSAMAARIRPAQLAKAVIIGNGESFRMCVIPADRKLILKTLNHHMQDHFRLLHEDEICKIFDDCDVGAIPAFGQVYGMPVTWDNALLDTDDIYIESGDHTHLLHLNRGAFMELMGRQDHCDISEPLSSMHDRTLH